ncbi:MAG: MBL fold metallo-hydrolase [Anaerolineales bacterium]|nr:MBL fold metallo-hydrolase [Anaerolineales bacterium]
MRPEIHTFSLGITRCYLIKQQCVLLIDCGDSGREDKFISELNRVGIQPSDIQLILMTHGHADHVGSAWEIREATGAKTVIHQGDSAWLETGRSELPPGVTLWGKVVVSSFKPLISRSTYSPLLSDIVIGDDEFFLDDFGVSGRIVHTPGHTKGSISVLLDTGEAFVGDLAMNGLPHRWGPGLPSYAEDIEEVKRSWAKLSQERIHTIYPGHGDPFPAEVIKTFAF